MVFYLLLKKKQEKKIKVVDILVSNIHIMCKLYIIHIYIGDLKWKRSIEETQTLVSIKDRKNLSTNGYLEITILITPKGNIHNNPIITFRGLPMYETDEFIYGLEEEIEKTTRTFKLGNKGQERNLIDALKIASRKFTKEKTGKKPFTNINLVNI